MSPKSEEQQKAADLYLKEKVDEFKVRVPKGRKQMIVAHAKLHGESLNRFVVRAIDEKMNRDSQEPDGK